MMMDYQKAADYWVEKDRQGVRMDQEELFARMEKFINAHNTCALATGWGDFIRCTPIEYNYKNGIFWMFSEGGLKFHGLEKNKTVCMAIYDEYKGFNQLNGMQITGSAEVVEPGTDEYMDLLAFKKISAESLKKLSIDLHLIKVTPSCIEFLSSDFTKSGFDARQQWTCPTANTI